MLVLVGRYLNNLDIVRMGRPIVLRLVGELNEDVEIVIRRGDQMLFLHKDESQRPVKYSVAVGGLAPLYSISAGKCILAFMPEEETGAYLDRVVLSPITGNTITDKNVLKRELELIRSNWLAYGREEYYDGVCGIAAPVLNIHGAIAGSIVVTMEAARFNPEYRAFIGPSCAMQPQGSPASSASEVHTAVSPFGQSSREKGDDAIIRPGPGSKLRQHSDFTRTNEASDQTRRQILYLSTMPYDSWEPLD